MIGRRALLANAVGLAGAVGLDALPALATGLRRPVFDAHIHYSHDALAGTPPAEAVAILRRAGLVGALVSSSDDEGTQALHALAPDIVVPSLRPYRRRSDLASWTTDSGIVPYVEGRLAKFRYRAIGEFHVDGEAADRPVVRRMVALAREHGLWLHAHSDAAAVDRLFAQHADARILWAHAGFAPLATVTAMLTRHERLHCDLSFRTEHARGAEVDPAWLAAFERFPTRFMVGTDTYTPARWSAVVGHADGVRQWVAALPEALAEAIAWRNAAAQFKPNPR